MSNYQKQLEKIVQETLHEAGFQSPIVKQKVAKVIVEDLFRTDNWEAIQERLNERISEELPPMDKNGKLI